MQVVNHATKNMHRVQQQEEEAHMLEQLANSKCPLNASCTSR